MIIIEGPVGVGKTQLVELLMQNGYTAFFEEMESEELLDKFYYDRKRYSFLVQIHFLSARLDQMEKAYSTKNSVVDRSIYGDYIFSKMLYLNGDFEEEEYKVYKTLLDKINRLLPKPDLIIHLTMSTNKIAELIQRRGRKYEQEVEYEYWNTLNLEYKKFFMRYSSSKVLEINVDYLDFQHDESAREFILNQINTALKEE